jgi:ribonuclease III family protein
VPAEQTPPSTFISQNFHHFINQQLASQLADCPVSAAEISAIAPVSLAYIGDAVFELYVRSRLLLPAQRIRDYHNQVVNRVKAEQQAQYVDLLMPHLSDAEQDILRRGRNATSGRHRRAAAQSYQKATGFETLLGFLYLSDQARLLELLSQLDL